jgi:hypothetical protein
LRYSKDDSGDTSALRERVVKDCLTLCRALGYDFNTVEFAVQDGIPYAIDFLNPAPDADVHSVGPSNFDWVVENMAELAIAKALSDEEPQTHFHWSRFLAGHQRKQVAAPS